MYLVRLQGENEKQKKSKYDTKARRRTSGFRQPPEEGMLFAVLLKDSSLYCKIRRWAAFKKKKKLRLYLGLIVPVDAQPI